MTYNPYLEHHGVKGMKCGVRKDRQRSEKSIKKRAEKDRNKELRTEAKAVLKAYKNQPFRGPTKSRPLNAKQQAVYDRVRAKNKTNPGYQRRVLKKANSITAKRMIATVAVGTAFQLALSNPNFHNSVHSALKRGGGMASSAMKNHARTQAGRKFASEMGINPTIYIDETGKLLKNFQPRF